MCKALIDNGINISCSKCINVIYNNVVHGHQPMMWSILMILCNEMKWCWQYGSNDDWMENVAGHWMLKKSVCMWDFEWGDTEGGIQGTQRPHLLQG